MTKTPSKALPSHPVSHGPDPARAAHRLAADVTLGVLLLGSPAASFAAQPPDQLGYEGQPGIQGGHCVRRRRSAVMSTSLRCHPAIQPVSL